MLAEGRLLVFPATQHLGFELEPSVHQPTPAYRVTAPRLIVYRAACPGHHAVETGCNPIPLSSIGAVVSGLARWFLTCHSITCGQDHQGYFCQPLGTKMLLQTTSTGSLIVNRTRETGVCGYPRNAHEMGSWFFVLIQLHSPFLSQPADNPILY